MVTLARLIGAFALVYVAALVLMYLMQNALLFSPDTRTYTQQQVGVSGYIDIAVKTQDGLLLHGWYAPAQTDKKTIVYFQGNASTWQWHAADFTPLIAKGYGVLLAGYRGYGGNPGSPSEAGLYQDAAAYIDALHRGQNIAYADIILYGESLGTGVAVEMASRHPDIGGIVLEAPYTSMADVASFHYPFVPNMHAMIRNKFDSLYKIGAIRAPKLFLIATLDTVIPARFARTLFEAAGQPKTVREFSSAGHRDIRRMGAMRDVIAFIEMPADK